MKITCLKEQAILDLRTTWEDADLFGYYLFWKVSSILLTDTSPVCSSLRAMKQAQFFILSGELKQLMQSTWTQFPTPLLQKQILSGSPPNSSHDFRQVWTGFSVTHHNFLILHNVPWLLWRKIGKRHSENHTKISAPIYHWTLALVNDKKHNKKTSHFFSRENVKMK